MAVREEQLRKRDSHSRILILLHQKRLHFPALIDFLATTTFWVDQDSGHTKHVHYRNEHTLSRREPEKETSGSSVIQHPSLNPYPRVYSVRRPAWFSWSPKADQSREITASYSLESFDNPDIKKAADTIASTALEKIPCLQAISYSPCCSHSYGTGSSFRFAP